MLHDTNRLGEAEPLKRRALAITEASFGKDHHNVAGTLINLASLLYDKAARERQGGSGHPWLCEAELLFLRALAIYKASFGEDHPYVAAALNNLAQLLQATNRREEAGPLLHRALTITEAGFGKDHPTVATSLNNLAMLLHATNRFEEAEPLLHRALAITEANLGKDHPTVAIRLSNLVPRVTDSAVIPERGLASLPGRLAEP